jgi:hypothetical protein
VGAKWNMGSPPDRLTAPTTTAGKNVWAVPPGETVARLVPESTAMQGGYTKQQTGGLFQDYATETQQLARSDAPDAWSKGVAMWESYFAGSQKDPITQRISMMQPDQLRKAAEDQMRRMYAAVGKTPPGATPAGSDEAMPEAQALEILRKDPTKENIKYFEETYGHIPDEFK